MHTSIGYIRARSPRSEIFVSCHPSSLRAPPEHPLGPLAHLSTRITVRGYSTIASTALITTPCSSVSHALVAASGSSPLCPTYTGSLIWFPHTGRASHLRWARFFMLTSRAPCRRSSRGLMMCLCLRVTWRRRYWAVISTDPCCRTPSCTCLSYGFTRRHGMSENVDLCCVASGERVQLSGSADPPRRVNLVPDRGRAAETRCVPIFGTLSHGA